MPDLLNSHSRFVFYHILADTGPGGGPTGGHCVYAILFIDSLEGIGEVATSKMAAGSGSI